METMVLSAATLALAFMELVKLLIRRVILKDPEFTFPAIYYTLMIPFLTALAGWLLGYIGWADPVLLEPQAVMQWAVSIMFELMFYHMGIEPIKNLARNK